MVVFGASRNAPGSIFEGGWERRAWFWRSKTTILACFCTHTWQHCANPPTLTKLWQGQQKSRFFAYRKRGAHAQKRHKIIPGAFRTKLPTKIVPKTSLRARRTQCWAGPGPSWVGLGLLLRALGRLLASLGRLWGCLGRILNPLGHVYGASWVHVGVQESSEH